MAIQLLFLIALRVLVLTTRHCRDASIQAVPTESSLVVPNWASSSWDKHAEIAVLDLLLLLLLLSVTIKIRKQANK
jgi:hypothetical protein